jgi:hypothetical protein
MLWSHALKRCNFYRNFYKDFQSWNYSLRFLIGFGAIKWDRTHGSLPCAW